MVQGVSAVAEYGNGIFLRKRERIKSIKIQQRKLKGVAGIIRKERGSRSSKDHYPDVRQKEWDGRQ